MPKPKVLCFTRVPTFKTGLAVEVAVEFEKKVALEAEAEFVLEVEVEA